LSCLRRARPVIPWACPPYGLVQVDDEAYREGLVQAGLPQAVAELLTSFGASARGGFLANVSPTIEDLTGRSATELDAVVRSTLKV